MRILLDLDGVLLDTMQHFCDHKKIKNPYHDSMNHGDYNLLYPWKFDLEFWLTIPWMHDAREIIETLEHAYGTHNTCIVTNPSDCPIAAQGKLIWIKKYMPGYHYLIGPSKHFTASKNSVLIDDWDINTDNFKQAGGAAILLPRPWNRNHKLVAMEYLHEQLSLL